MADEDLGKDLSDSLRSIGKAMDAIEWPKLWIISEAYRSKVAETKPRKRQGDGKRRNE
jgi:hypothetical protein